MDYVSCGDLKHILDEYNVFDENHARTCTAQIILALKDLRRNQFVHRDLKPDNVLLDGDGLLKLIDFGLSSEIMQNETIDNTGTLGYCAPEVLTNQATTYTSDYWSLGCMIYEFLFGIPPFNDENAAKTIENTLKINYTCDLEDTADPENPLTDAIDLIKKLLVFEPEKRLGHNSIEELMNHPWFKDFNWENIPDLCDLEIPDKMKQAKPLDVNSKEYQDIMSDMKHSQKVRGEFSSNSSCDEEGEQDDDFSSFNQVSVTYQFDKAKKVIGKVKVSSSDNEDDDACPIAKLLTPRSGTPGGGIPKVIPSPMSPKSQASNNKF